MQDEEALGKGSSVQARNDVAHQDQIRYPLYAPEVLLLHRPYLAPPNVQSQKARHVAQGVLRDLVEVVVADA